MAVLPPDPVFCLKSDMGHVHGLCFDNSETFTETLYASTESGFVYVWDLNRNRLKYKQALGDSIQAIHVDKDTLMTQEKQGILKLWKMNIDKFDFMHDVQFYGGYCKCKIINNYILLPQNDSTVELFDIHNLQTVRRFQPEDTNFGHAMCLEVCDINSQKYVLCGYETGDVVLFEYESGKMCSKLRLHECITSLTFDPTSGRGVAGNVGNILDLFTIDSDLSILRKCEISIVNDGCAVVKIRPDRKILVTGGADSRLRLYSWKTLRTLVVLNDHRKSITDIQFTPNLVKIYDSKLMACSSADGIISLWNLYN